MMKVLLFGSNGQVGSEIYKMFSSNYEIYPFTRNSANFKNPDQIKKCINKVQPELIINAAAYTNVNKAEQNKELAEIINCHTVAVIANECKKNNIILIHFSTDYVFDGISNKPYIETDKSNPLSIYGKSKRNGELKILESGCNFLIFRTSWIYSAQENNFIRKIIDLSLQEEKLCIVDDQFGTPTSAEFISVMTNKAVKYLLENKNIVKISGIYHLTPNGYTNWCEYAKRFIDQISSKTKKKHATIFAKKTSIETGIARRPAFSVLNNSKFSKVFKKSIYEWNFYLDQFIDEQILNDSK